MSKAVTTKQGEAHLLRALSECWDRRSISAREIAEVALDNIHQEGRTADIDSLRRGADKLLAKLFP